MRKIILFMLTTVDGFFEGPDHDISWHNVDDEFNQFAIDQLQHIDLLLFGRKTYDVMVAYWPTQIAKQSDPVVAGLMNNTSKIVFSKTLRKADWENTILKKEINKEELMEIKQSKGKDIAIFGSSDLSVDFIKRGLLDEIRIMVNPVILGQGKQLFAGIDEKVKLNLTNTRKFSNGNILLYYQIA